MMLIINCVENNTCSLCTGTVLDDVLAIKSIQVTLIIICLITLILSIILCYTPIILPKYTLYCIKDPRYVQRYYKKEKHKLDLCIFISSGFISVIMIFVLLILTTQVLNTYDQFQKQHLMVVIGFVFMGLMSFILFIYVAYYITVWMCRSRNYLHNREYSYKLFEYLFQHQYIMFLIILLLLNIFIILFIIMMITILSLPLSLIVILVFVSLIVWILGIILYSVSACDIKKFK